MINSVSKSNNGTFEGKGRGRMWLVTRNTPNQDVINAIFMLGELVKDFELSYLVYQYECGKKERLHFHCMLVFKEPKRFNQLKKLEVHGVKVFDEGKIEQVKYPAKCRDYCMKERTRVSGPWEYGLKWDVVGSGVRSDLEVVKEMLKKGEKLGKVYDEHFECSAKYYKFFDRYIAVKAQEDADVFKQCIVTVFYGPTGIGKTTDVKKRFPHIYEMGDMINGKLWADGYTGQNEVLFDDYDGGVPFRAFLKMLGGYRYRAETKGGHCYMQPGQIFITTNKWITQWYPKESDISPLWRRIHLIYSANLPLKDGGTWHEVAGNVNAATSEERLGY